MAAGYGLARVPQMGRMGQASPASAACPPRPQYGAEAVACDPHASEYLCGCRVYALIFDSGAVVPPAPAVGSTAVLLARPQKPFRGQLLVIPSTLGPFFTFAPLSVGTDPQVVNLGGQFLAQGFAEGAVNNWGNFDGSTAGVDIQLTVTNISAIARRFFAYVWGTAYKDN